MIEDKNLSYALQTIAREQLIKKILGDVLTDITICKLEGWDWRIYPNRIKKEMENILKARSYENRKESNKVIRANNQS